MYIGMIEVRVAFSIWEVDERVRESRWRGLSMVSHEHCEEIGGG